MNLIYVAFDVRSNRSRLLAIDMPPEDNATGTETTADEGPKVVEVWISSTRNDVKPSTLLSSLA